MDINNWKFDTVEGTVILFDALGTKGIWKDQNPKAVTKMWDVFGYSIKNNFEKISPNKTSCHIFSDTVIITIEGKLEDNFVNISASLFATFATALAAKINLRGAINFGTIYKSSNTIIGPTIDNCASFHTLPNLVGIVMCPTMQSLLENNTSIKNSDKDFLFPKYDMPLKDNKFMKNVRMMRIIGEYPFERHLIRLIPLEIKTIRELVNYKIQNTSEIEFQLKWKNTLDFLDTIKFDNEEKIMQNALFEISKI